MRLLNETRNERGNETMKLSHCMKYVVLSSRMVTKYHRLTERRVLTTDRVRCYLETTKQVVFWGTMQECYTEAKRIESYIDSK